HRRRFYRQRHRIPRARRQSPPRKAVSNSRARPRHREDGHPVAGARNLCLTCGGARHITAPFRPGPLARPEEKRWGFAPLGESQEQEMQKFMVEKVRNYIGGEWAASTSTEYVTVTNPATGDKLGSVPMGTARDVDAAVGAAKTAFNAWRDVP